MSPALTDRRSFPTFQRPKTTVGTIAACPGIRWVLRRVSPRVAAAIAAGITLALTGCAPKATDPSFPQVHADAFGVDIDAGGYYSSPALADLDDDGDLDMFFMAYTAEGLRYFFYENVGPESVAAENVGPENTAHEGDDDEPNFAAPADLEATGLRAQTDDGYFVFATPADLNGDGDWDAVGFLLADANPTHVGWAAADGSSDALRFATSRELVAIAPDAPVVFGRPAVADIDGDGDIDIIAAGYHQDDPTVHLVYWANEGSRRDPAFAAAVVDPFGAQPIAGLGYYTGTAAADIDGDGDLDLFVGINSAEGGRLFFYENTGTRREPRFAAPTEDPFSVVADDAPESRAFPSLGDIDGDGDLDLVVGVDQREIGRYGLRYAENRNLPRSQATAD